MSDSVIGFLFVAQALWTCCSPHQAEKVRNKAIYIKNGQGGIQWYEILHAHKSINYAVRLQLTEWSLRKEISDRTYKELSTVIIGRSF